MSNMMSRLGHRMDWFFLQWVYGTEVPRYKFDYTLTPQVGGNFLLKASLSQSEVSEDFIALVPLYADFDGHIVRFGQVRMKGTSTAPEISLPFPILKTWPTARGSLIKATTAFTTSPT